MRGQVGARAVVVTDVEGSTTLLRRLGADFDALLGRHHVLVRRAMTDLHGIEAGSAGDGFTFVFDEPVDAVAASVEAQRQLTNAPWASRNGLRVRMGIHVGEVRQGVDGAFNGLGLHLGARVAPAAHGGQIVLSSAVADAVAGALPDRTGLLDIGVFHVRDFDDPVRLFQVLHPDLDAVFPPLRVPSVGVHNLAPQRTSFVGRVAEIDELTKATDVCPLVTIVGPGGMGKSRLATEIGRRVAGRYAGGVWLVSLDSVADDGVVDAVKRALLLADEPRRTSLETVLDRLSGTPTLLILDSCEQVLDGCVALVDALLAASATTRVVATTREHLGLAGETVFRIGPLDLPDEVRASPGGSDAVDLFVARGAQALRSFALTPDNADLIASVCRRLDGSPLALELAAARLTDLALDQLHDQLDDALNALEPGRRGGVDRQRTLRATLEWSHRLLAPEDRRVFAALSVFRDGFTGEAVDAIVETASVRANLEHLVDQSLVEIDVDAEPPRYRLLQTIAAFAAEQLAARADAGTVADRHAAFFAGLAADCAAAADRVAALDRLAREHANLLAAVERRARRGRSDDHRDLVLLLAEFWVVRGHWEEARRQHLVYLGREDRDPTLDARVLANIGALSVDQAEYGRARDEYSAALASALEAGDARLRGSCLLNLGNIAYMLGHYPQARAHYETGLELARQTEDPGLAATCIANLGDVARRFGDLDGAQARYTEAVDIARQIGDRRNEGAWVGAAGEVASALGDHEKGRVCLEEALAIARDLGDRLHEGTWVGDLGNIASRSGDYPRALVRYQEALDIACALGDRFREAVWTSNLGDVAFLLGHQTEARERFLDALGIARQIRERYLEAHCVGDLGNVASDLGEHVEASTRLRDALDIYLELGLEASDLLVSSALLLIRLARPTDAWTLLSAADALDAPAQKKRTASDRKRYDTAVAACRHALDAPTLAAASARAADLDWLAAAAMAKELLASVLPSGGR
jgi:predicted ATPase/class 3 adenylate cyclase